MDVRVHLPLGIEYEEIASCPLAASFLCSLNLFPDLEHISRVLKPLEPCRPEHTPECPPLALGRVQIRLYSLEKPCELRHVCLALRP